MAAGRRGTAHSLPFWLRIEAVRSIGLKPEQLAREWLLAVCIYNHQPSNKHLLLILKGALLLGDSDQRGKLDGPAVELCQSLPIGLDESGDAVLIQGLATLPFWQSVKNSLLVLHLIRSVLASIFIHSDFIHRGYDCMFHTQIDMEIIEKFTAESQDFQFDKASWTSQQS